MNTPPDLNAAVTDYLARLRVERRASAHTLDAYGRDLGVLLDWMVNQGITSWPALTAEALRAFIASEHRRGLSSKSLQRRLSACRGLLRDLLRRGSIANDPSSGLRAPKAPRKLPQVLDADEMGRLVEVPTAGPLGLRDRAMLELFYSSGLRLSELCGLRWGALDLVEGLVRIDGKGGKIGRAHV